MLDVAPVGGRDEGRPTEPVRPREVGIGAEHLLEDVDEPRLPGREERVRAGGVLAVDVGARVDQRADDVGVAAVGGVRDGRPPVRVGVVGVRAGVEQAPNLVGVAGRRRRDERAGRWRSPGGLVARARGDEERGERDERGEHHVTFRHKPTPRPGPGSHPITIAVPPAARPIYALGRGGTAVRTRRAQVHRLPSGATEDDRLAVEEPLEIRIGGRAVAVTMRTPGHDEELALGFCLTEGLRPTGARPPDDLAANVIDVDAPGADLDRVQRSFYTSSSCGVCGKGALEAVAVEAPRIESQVTVAVRRRRRPSRIACARRRRPSP